jgi:two-component system, NarL family, sensor histidine kinase DevS
VLLRDGDDLVVAARAGEVGRDPAAVRIPAGDAVQNALARHRPLRLPDARMLFADPAQLGVTGARTAMVVPLAHRGASLGVMVAIDRVRGEDGFGPEQELVVEPFAAQVATAVAGARNAEAERLRRSLAAAEAERRRWARELHDETLQAMGALKILIARVARLDDPEAMRTAMRDATEQLTSDIAGLRSLIAELRPAALDELGLEPAIASLAQRTGAQSGLEVETDLELPPERDIGPDLATTVYRLVQEALTNVVKHADATRVTVVVRCAGGALELAVRDDGTGFDSSAAGDGGFGLTGMRERAELAGGELRIGAGATGGTVVQARLPLR